MPPLLEPFQSACGIETQFNLTRAWANNDFPYPKTHLSYLPPSWNMGRVEKSDHCNTHRLLRAAHFESESPNPPNLNPGNKTQISIVP